MPRSLNPPVAVTHVYHTGDPIPLGTCKGSLSSCAQGGYALETRCHLGKSIVYDTLDKLGWVPNVRRHIIREVIHNVLEAEDVEWEEGREVPLAREEADCVVRNFPAFARECLLLVNLTYLSFPNPSTNTFVFTFSMERRK